MRPKNNKPRLWRFPHPVRMLLQIFPQFVLRLAVATELIGNENSQVRSDEGQLVEFLKPVGPVLKFNCEMKIPVVIMLRGPVRIGRAVNLEIFAASFVSQFSARSFRDFVHNWGPGSVALIRAARAVA